MKSQTQRLLTTAAVLVSLVGAGAASSYALASAGAPADTTPAPVTTVVATGPTPLSVTPDAPPAPAKKKPKTVTKTVAKTAAKTPAKHATSSRPAVKTSSGTTASTRSGRTSVTGSSTSTHTVRSTRVYTPPTTRRSPVVQSHAATTKKKTKKKTANTGAGSAAAARAAVLKAYTKNVPKPSYPLTPAGGGDHPRTPIHHFVYLLQENHTFDNYFGTYGRGSDGIPSGVCMAINLSKPKQGCIKPFHLGGQAVTDLGHNPVIFRGEFNGGKMNGFANTLRLQDVDPKEVMGYYDARDIPYYWNLADNYVLFDHFFSSASDGSGANHMYWVAGYPADPHDTPKGGFTMPTIFDRLEKAGISWKFYVSNYDPKVNFRAHTTGDRDSQVVWVPLLNYARFLDDPKLASHIVPLSDYYKDLANGTLPAVSYIAPSGASEHPPGSIQSGERFVRTLVNNLMASKEWSSSALLLAYDDWGGWYDHVRPPKVDAFGLGFRVPGLLVSPYARKGFVDHTRLDFTSGLKFVEQNWGLAPLTQRDAKANGLASAFNFSVPPRPARIIPATRVVVKPVVAKRSVIYPAYGLGAALVLLLMVVALIRTRRTRARRDVGPSVEAT